MHTAFSTINQYAFDKSVFYSGIQHCLVVGRTLVCSHQYEKFLQQAARKEVKLDLIIRTAECENLASAEGWDSGTDRDSNN